MIWNKTNKLWLATKILSNYVKHVLLTGANILTVFLDDQIKRYSIDRNDNTKNISYFRLGGSAVYNPSPPIPLPASPSPPLICTVYDEIICTTHTKIKSLQPHFFSLYAGIHIMFLGYGKKWKSVVIGHIQVKIIHFDDRSMPKIVKYYTCYSQSYIICSLKRVENVKIVWNTVNVWKLKSTACI